MNINEANEALFSAIRKAGISDHILFSFDQNVEGDLRFSDSKMLLYMNALTPYSAEDISAITYRPSGADIPPGRSAPPGYIRIAFANGDELKISACARETMASMNWGVKKRKASGCLNIMELYEEYIDIRNRGVITDEFVVTDDTLVMYNGEKSSQIVIPEGVKCIAPSLFEDSDYIEEVILPASLEVIGERAFAFCGSLSALSFDSCSMIKEIFPDAFTWCEKLRKVVWPSSINFLFTEAFSYTDITSVDCVIKHMADDAFLCTPYEKRMV